ncbi:hypothetical protein D3C72_1414960 [compost metagenome]
MRRRQAVVVDQHEGRVREIDKETRNAEAADEGERQEIPVREQQPVGGDCRAEIAVGPVALGPRLCQLRRQQDQADEGCDHHRIEYAAPAVELDDGAARQRRQDRRDAEHQHQERHQPCGLHAGVHVANDGARDDHAGGSTDALQEAEGNEGFDIGRKRAADTGQRKQADAEIERRLAAPHVRQGAVDELKNGEGNEECEQAELHDTGLCGEILADRRQCREIHVDRKRPDR